MTGKEERREREEEGMEEDSRYDAYDISQTTHP